MSAGAGRRLALGAAAVVAATWLWSLATGGYRFAAGDDYVQAAIVLHAADPTLLAADPAVTEVAPAYRSLFFPLLAAGTRATSLLDAYALAFVAVRVALLAAFWRLAWAVTRDGLASALAVVVVAGFGLGGPGVYFGGVALVEDKLVPRDVALPCAWLALAAVIEGRRARSLAWLVPTALFHPVTGVGTAGLVAVYAWLDGAPGRGPWPARGALAGLAAACAVVLAGLLVAGSFDAGRVTGAWRAALEESVGPWVLLGRDGAWYYEHVPAATAIALGGLAAASDRVRAVGVRIGLAVAAALAVHAVGVDGASIHALLQASPQRTSFAWTSFAAIALAATIAAGWRRGGAPRALAAALAVAVSLRWSVEGTLAGVAALAAAPVLARLGAAPRIATLAQAALGLAALAAWSALPPGLAGPSLRGLEGLRARGIVDADALAVGRHVRERSTPEELLYPPLGLALGWRVFAQRAAPLDEAMFSYTHLSPDLAARYTAAVAARRALAGASWRALADAARSEGATWLVVDERSNPRRPGDPEPEFASGPYAALRVQAGERAGR